MSKDPNESQEVPAPSTLEMVLVALLSDDYYRGRSRDGTGFDLMRAPYNREWMDRSTNRFAYRCLPLTIANQMGLWITNPVGFTAYWNGDDQPGGVQIEFDEAAEKWGPFISNHFGNGMLTWNNPFLIRTNPRGSRLLVTGPANRFKTGVQPLMGLIESDWIVATFTMNWRILVPEAAVRFELGEPIMQLMPISNNFVRDLETAQYRVCRREQEPALVQDFENWSRDRDAFHKLVREGQNREQWQRDYFLGRDMKNTPARTDHHNMKVAIPPIQGADQLGLGAAAYYVNDD